MARRRGTAGTALCAAAVCLVLAGCSSSAGAQKPSSAPTSTTAAPTTSAASSPTPAASSSAAPLSAFEGDPAVRAFRAWASEAARTINTGHYTSAGLQALMTPAFAKQMKQILGDEVGHYYPGPVPFTPLNLVTPSAATRRSDGCLLSGGYSQNPATHKPAQPRRILPIEISLVYQGSRWLMSGFYTTKNVSCAGVKIGTPSW